MEDMFCDKPESIANRGQLDNKIAEAERDYHTDEALLGILNKKCGFEAMYSISSD